MAQKPRNRSRSHCQKITVALLMKRQVTYFTLLEEACNSNNVTADDTENAPADGELAVTLSAARAKREWAILTGVPGDGADLGRFFRVAVPSNSGAAKAYVEAKGLSARRKAASSVFDARVCWVKPNCSGVDLSRPFIEPLPQDEMENIIPIFTREDYGHRSDVPPLDKDPNFELFPNQPKRVIKTRSPPPDLSEVVKEENVSLSQIGEELLDSFDDGDSNFILGKCCLRAAEGAAPKKSTDAAVAPLHGSAGPVRWALERADARYGQWDRSPEVQGLWPTVEELKLESSSEPLSDDVTVWYKLPATAPSRFDQEPWDVSFEAWRTAEMPGSLGTLEPIEWPLRPDVFQPPRRRSLKRRRRRAELTPLGQASPQGEDMTPSWDVELVGDAWLPIAGFGALEPGADGAAEGKPRKSLEKRVLTSIRRRVRLDMIIGHLRSEEALAVAAGETPAVDIATFMRQYAAAEQPCVNEVLLAELAEFRDAPIETGNEVANELGNNVSNEMDNNVSNEMDNKVSNNVDNNVSSETGDNMGNLPGEGQVKALGGGRSKRQKELKRKIADWKKTNPGRPVYETLAAHRRSPRWRDYDSAGLADWHNSFLQRLAEAAGALEKVVLSPRYEFTPRSRKTSFVKRLRSDVALAGPGTEMSRSQQLAAAMASAKTCIFRSRASEVVDASLGRRWSFKVLGGSVSPPVVSGISRSPGTSRPTGKQHLFGPTTGAWSWEGHTPRAALNVPSQELADRFAAASTCVFRDARSVHIDASVHPRMTYKVQGRSISYPPVLMGYQLPTPLRPSMALLCFASNATGWSKGAWADCPESPGKHRAKLAKKLAKLMAASDHIIYMSFPEGWTKAPKKPPADVSSSDDEITQQVANQSSQDNESSLGPGMSLCPRLTKPLLQALDVSGTGDLDFQEFMAFQMTLAELSDHFADDMDDGTAFQTADRDGNNRVDKHEFAHYTGALLDVLKMEGVCPSMDSLVLMAKRVVGNKLQT